MHQDSTGRELPCEVRFSRLPSDDKRLIRVSITDIAERKRNEALSYSQNKVLEMIAASAPQDRILRAICRVVERIGDDFKAAIMRLDPDGNTLSVAQAPSLSDAFKLSLEFIDVGAESLTCGSAVHHRQDRITEDISKDDSWTAATKEAKKHGIRAVWSFVVNGEAGRTIGTLDVYLNECRVPTTEELDQLSRMAHLTGIAVTRQEDEERLRNSEAR